MALTFGTSTHDVTAVAYKVVSPTSPCSATPLASQTIPLESEAASTGVLPDGGSPAHAFADGLFVLAPGNYRICATPLAGATPSAACAPVSNLVTVTADATSELVLMSQCAGDASGGAGVVVALNDPPAISALAVAPSRLITVCQPATITVTATDPNGDAVTFNGTILSGPTGTPGSLTFAANVGTFTPGSPGDYQVQVTASDALGGATSLQLPIHVSAATCNPAGLVAVPRGPGITSEKGGEVTIDVSLATAPTAKVVVNVTVTDATEATVCPASLDFAPGAWNQPQSVVVRGLGDLLADGTVPYEVVLSATSADANYANLPAQRLAFQNLDGAAFAGIGDLPGGNTASAAYGVNANGKVVVGYSVSDTGPHAIRWSPDTALQPLEGASGRANAVNAAGDVIVGVATDSEGHPSAVRWANGSGPEYLLLPSVFTSVNTEARGISADGQVIVGETQNRQGPIDPGGTLWRGGVWELTNTGVLTGADADGDVVVGYNSAARSQPFDLASTNGVLLPFFEEDLWCPDDECFLCVAGGICGSRALGVSRNGNTIVGMIGAGGHKVAVKWLLNTGSEVKAKVLSSAIVGEAMAVSGDGQVVVGYEDVNNERTATRWTTCASARIAELLTQAGVALNGWKLTSARAASDDGQVIVGEGVNPNGAPEGWIAVLPK